MRSFSRTSGLQLSRQNQHSHKTVVSSYSFNRPTLTIRVPSHTFLPCFRYSTTPTEVNVGIHFRSRITPTLQQHIDLMRQRYEQLDKQLTDNVIPMNQVKEAAQEHYDCSLIVEGMKRIDQKKEQLRELQTFLDESDEIDLVQMTKEDIAETITALQGLEEDLFANMVTHDPVDSRNAILEIRPGTGGSEAQLFAKELFDMYNTFSRSKGWEFDTLDEATTEVGGIREATACLKGDGVFGRMKFESGVHRVQRNPVTEKSGKLHTSTVTVAILPEVEEIDIKIPDKDLRIDVYRAGGAGGQHVNKTESAVRITHIPTGIVVAIQDERSQHRNKARAMSIIRAKVFEKEQEKAHAERSANKKAQIGSGDRSERIRTYNFQQGRITDHRTNSTKHEMERMMSGDLLDDFLDELVQWDNKNKLAALLQEDGGTLPKV